MVPLLPPAPPSSCPPHQDIRIVTWYMSDVISFSCLLHLLTTQPQYERVSKLELVTPSADVSEELVDRMADYLEQNRSLQEVTLFTVKIAGIRSTLSNPRELQYLQLLESSVANNCGGVDCSIKLVPTGDPNLLCESLMTTIQQGQYRRHLALDGILLKDISRPDLTKLAFDLSWDRSIHVCLFKDMPQSLLDALLPKLVHAPLHSLKIVYDPAVGGLNSRRLGDAPIIDTLVLQRMLQSPKLTTLQRLYFGHVRFQPANTLPLIRALRDSTTLRLLEFALCQFESGTATPFHQLLEQAKQPGHGISLWDIRFQYPVICKPHSPHTPQNAIDNIGGRLGEGDSSQSCFGSLSFTTSNISSP